MLLLLHELVMVKIGLLQLLPMELDFLVVVVDLLSGLEEVVMVVVEGELECKMVLVLGRMVLMLLGLEI